MHRNRRSSRLAAPGRLLVPLIAVICTVLAAGDLDSPVGEARAGDPPDAETSSSADEHAEPPESESEESDAEKSGKPSPSASKLLEEAGEIAERVARIRGLATRHPIEKGVKTREELRKILIEKLAEEQSKRQMSQEASVFQRLGLLPLDFDYRQVILDVLTEQIAGFYDQKSGSLNIMVGIPLDLQRPAMAHEIFHAIQDQHFDLTEMLEPFSSRENGDFQLARSALVEGDATVLMIDYSLYERDTLPREQIRSIVDIPMMANMLKQLDYEQLGALEKLSGGQKASEESGQAGGEEEAEAQMPTELYDSALSKAPKIIRRALIFPYLAGMRFVIAMRSGRSWEEFNDIYESPPVSTEQILHPKRYARSDEPVMLDYSPVAVLQGYERIYDTVLGEFQMRLFLEHHLEGGSGEDASRAVDIERAAKGWDGDRLLAFRNDQGLPLVTHMSVWDSRQDATEYYNALVEVAGRRFPDSTRHTASGKHGSSTCFHHEDDDHEERIYLERWGDAVLHIEGVPSKVDDSGNETDPTTYMLREQIWKSLERRPFREVYREKMEERAQNKGSEKAAE